MSKPKQLTLRQRVRAAQAAAVPPGWMDIATLAKREGYTSPRTAYDTVRAALKLGFLERRNFRVVWGTRVRSRPYYRYTSPAKKRWAAA